MPLRMCQVPGLGCLGTRQQGGEHVAAEQVHGHFSPIHSQLIGLNQARQPSDFDCHQKGPARRLI